jgi:Fe-S-cluster-containing hydrogenase component 2
MPKKRKRSKSSKSSSVDIFQLLTQTTEKEKSKRREELLAPLGIKEFFTEGSITINKRTCKGLECKLCIKACPTNALFWKAGEVGMTEELCIYCGACVLSCIVDDCINIVRKRPTGEVERFSKPRDFTALQHSINAKKRGERIQEVFPKPEDYIERYKQTR